MRGASRMHQSGLLARIVRMGGGVAIALLVPTVIGLAIDSRFATRPWGTLVALLIASLTAMVLVVRMTFDVYQTFGETRPPAVPPPVPNSVKEDEHE